MYNPFLMMAQCQMAALEGWLKLNACMWRQYGNMLTLPQSLAKHPPYVRWHDVCFRGPDLNDHYGRRPHDVDVERV